LRSTDSPTKSYWNSLVEQVSIPGHDWHVTTPDVWHTTLEGGNGEVLRSSNGCLAQLSIDYKHELTSSMTPSRLFMVDSAALPTQCGARRNVGEPAHPNPNSQCPTQRTTRCQHPLCDFTIEKRGRRSYAKSNIRPPAHPIITCRDPCVVRTAEQGHKGTTTP
jgi:hypothetical protein